MLCFNISKSITIFFEYEGYMLRGVAFSLYLSSLSLSLPFFPLPFSLSPSFTHSLILTHFLTLSISISPSLSLSLFLSFFLSLWAKGIELNFPRGHGRAIWDWRQFFLSWIFYSPSHFLSTASRMRI